MSRAALAHVMRETIRRRNHAQRHLLSASLAGHGAARLPISAAGVTPTLVCTARSIPPARMEAQAVRGIDDSSRRPTSAAALRHQDGHAAAGVPGQGGGAAEGRARGLVRRRRRLRHRGASSNAWIVTGAERVVTRQADERILAGVTRATVIDAIRSCGLALEEPFSLAEALAAREAFVTSASNTVMPVVTVDGVLVGDGLDR